MGISAPTARRRDVLVPPQRRRHPLRPRPPRHRGHRRRRSELPAGTRGQRRTRRPRPRPARGRRTYRQRPPHGPDRVRGRHRPQQPRPGGTDPGRATARHADPPQPRGPNRPRRTRTRSNRCWAPARYTPNGPSRPQPGQRAQGGPRSRNGGNTESPPSSSAPGLTFRPRRLWTLVAKGRHTRPHPALQGFFRLAGRPRVTGLWSQASAVANPRAPSTQTPPRARDSSSSAPGCTRTPSGSPSKADSSPRASGCPRRTTSRRARRTASTTP